MYAPDEDRTLAPFEHKGLNPQFPNIQKSVLTTVIPERRTLLPSFYKLDHSAVWNTKVRARKRAENWKNDSIH